MTDPGSRRPALRRLAVAWSLAVVPLLGSAACGPGPVSPLPAYGGSPPASASVGASATSPAGPTTMPAPSTPVTVAATSSRLRPVRPATTGTTKTRTVVPPTSSPTTASPCRGVERYDLDLQNNELALIPPLCFRVGSLIHVHSIGPGQITVEPSTVATMRYEGATVDIYLIGPGIATVTIPQNDQVYPITVVVI